jgi:hypothetical protein
MRTADKGELVAIVVVVGLVAAARGWLPVRVEIGNVVLGAAALLLFHGLLRDLVRVRAARRAAAASARTVTCVCAESTIGLGVIVAGLVMVFGFTPIVVHVPAYAWPLGVLAVMSFGFLTRNLVLDWRERRLRWESDHSVAVAWKK